MTIDYQIYNALLVNYRLTNLVVISRPVAAALLQTLATTVKRENIRQVPTEATSTQY